MERHHTVMQTYVTSSKRAKGLAGCSVVSAVSVTRWARGARGGRPRGGRGHWLCVTRDSRGAGASATAWRQASCASEQTKHHYFIDSITNHRLSPSSLVRGTKRNGISLGIKCVGRPRTCRPTGARPPGSISSSMRHGTERPIFY
ncbi:unnamed protein product [Pieris brassicae]|uniref:Uncharacterized protein n=1 Tax=Pieris brassicae TaxID=7116 RepID=A0A9P0TNU9_PIEBR|nr:unnamed protein product [Pieris brassicae]